MPRPEKVQAVAEIKERFEGARAVFLAEYAGLSVKEQQALRRELRANDAEFKVVKMTLARRATDALEIEGLDDLLLGPTGLAFADGDPVGAAKVLKDFSQDHDVFVVKGGLLGSDFLSPEKISDLADIEPREVLLAKFAGAMKAPMANMAGLLAALPRNTASVLQQLLESKQADAPEDDTTSATGAEPSEEAADETADEAAEATASDEAGEPAEETAGGEAEAQPSDETEDDDATATVEASDDAADETENEDGAPSDDDATDEASDDDAEEK